MRTLAQPSMVCNDSRMVEDGITCFRMQNSWLVPDSATPDAVIGHVANVARSCPNGRLRNLILHCHGSAARMTIGCGSFGHHNVSLFKHLAGKVGHIWLVSCSVASQGEPSSTTIRRRLERDRVTRQAARNVGLQVREYIYHRLYNGIRFCQDIATAACCDVTAADREQVGTSEQFLPFGMIDDFEGLCWTWDNSRTVISTDGVG
jgi:hypothetical protein